MAGQDGMTIAEVVGEVLRDEHADVPRLPTSRELHSEQAGNSEIARTYTTGGPRGTVILCYCVTVRRRNITIAVPEDVHRAARIRAAERGTSVSALVGEYLHSLLSEREREFSRLEAQQKQVQREIDHFSADDRLSRHEVHGRAVR